MNTWKLPLGLAACALLAATADKAFAQADAPVIAEPQALPPAPVEPAPVYPAPVYPAPAYPGATYAAPAYPVPAAPHAMPAPGAPVQPASYPPEYEAQRAAWVSECAERYLRDWRDGKSGRRKREDEAFDWCEDYLARHTSAPANGYGQPVMMVQVMVPKRGPCPEEVIEEVVEEPRPIRRYIQPRPAPDKRIRLTPSKSKYIKSP